jgi:energy-coupling factor transporter ATP-binding protein EcfA2
MALACNGLTFAYDEGGSRVLALESVTFEQPAGSAAALLGPTGSGKSTLLQLVRGLLDRQSGSVELDGIGAGDPRYEALRRQVGLVFQMPELQLFAATALEDVCFGPRQLGWSPSEVGQAAEAALMTVGLPASRFARRHPHSLSGGEQRRLALAGVLAMRPRLLLLDEPFVGLDPRARADLVVVLATLRSQGAGFILATHDIDLAWLLCDSRLLLDQGRLEEAGPWGFGEGGEDALRAHRLRLPFLVELWERLGRPLAEAPRTAAEAAEVLA